MAVIGIFGGSFNPVHRAHIAMAEVARDTMNLDEVWLMPTLQNRLKLITGMEPFQHRYEMCRIAAKSRNHWLKATNFEQKIQDNRTLEILRRLKIEYPEHRFVWLMGSDGFAQLEHWYGWKDLLREFPVAVFDRPDQCDTLMATTAATEFIDSRLSNPNTTKDKIGWTILDHDPLALSSTEIRASLCHSRQSNGVLPEVLSYIQQRDLYRKDKWYVPEIEDKDIESLALHAKITPTLYNRDNIYSDPDENSFQECKDLIKYTGETIRDIVALKPERAALHDLIVILSTQFQIQDYEILKEKVDCLYCEIVLPAIEKHKNEFQEIEYYAQQTVEKYENDRCTDEFSDLLKQRLLKAENHAEWTKISETSRQKIKNHIIQNTILRQKIEVLTNSIVQTVLQKQEMYEKYNLQRLEKFSSTERQVFLVTGGPAVGKGRVVDAIEAGQLGTEPVDLKEFSKNNPDFYKEILLSPEDLGPYLPYYGSLTHQESFLISDKIFLAWRKMAEAGYAPHFLLDTARPHPWVMDILATGKSPIHIFMVTCDVEKALERNYTRGLETKRFMPTKTLLTFHQCEFDMLQTAIEKHNPHILLIDTNNASPILAAIRPQNEDFVVYRKATWQYFQKTRVLNIEALNTNELFLSATAPVNDPVGKLMPN